MTNKILKKEKNVHIYSQEKNINTLLKEIGSYQILLPEYQRAYQWNKEEISLLIKSLFQGIPIPPIYLYKESEEDIQYKILDGQQRLFGLFLYHNNLFFKNDFKLGDGSVCYSLKSVPKLEGPSYSESIKKLCEEYETSEIEKLLYLEIMNNPEYLGDVYKTKYYLDEQEITYSELEFEEKLRFLGFSLPVVYIISDKEFAKKIFKTINSTSKPLSNQQIREGENWDFFKQIYENENELEFINSTKRTYFLIEDIFEILIKACYIKEKNTFENIKTLKLSKASLLDQANKELLNNKNGQYKILEYLKQLVELTELKITIEKLGLRKKQKKLLLILTLVVGEKKVLENIENVLKLISIIENLNDLEKNKLSFEINLRKKYYSDEEVIYEIFSREEFVQMEW